MKQTDIWRRRSTIKNMRRLWKQHRAYFESKPTQAQQDQKRVSCQPEWIKKWEKSRKTKNRIELFRFRCLCWRGRLIPLSSRVEKFKAIHDKQVAKYGKCLTIVLGEFDGKEAAFLLQNMFPIRDYYLDHIHTRNNNPVPVKHSIHKEVTTRMKKIRQLHSRGKKVVFPDIDRLEQIMLAEVKDNAAE